jgi:p-aminobenzoyl-glutamate transporter AbgT
MLLILAPLVFIADTGPYPIELVADTLTVTSSSNAKLYGLAVRVAIGIMHAKLFSMVELVPLQSVVSTYQLACKVSEISILYALIVSPPVEAGAFQVISTPPVLASIEVITASICPGIVAALMEVTLEKLPQP